MFLLALCLFGTAMAAPAIQEAPLLPAETHVLVSPYITYSAPILPMRTLEMELELEPKEELPEPEEEFTEPEEPKEELYEEPKEELYEEPKEELYEEPKEELYEEPKEELYEEPKEELYEEPKEELYEEPKEDLPEPPKAPGLLIPVAPKPIGPVVVRLEVPKPPSFISNWFSSLPNFSLPSFIGDWFRPTSNPTKLMYPAYYTGYPGPVIVEAPKP